MTTPRLLGLLGWLCVHAAAAQTPVLTLTDSARYVNLWGQTGVDFYVDSSRYLTRQQVERRAFRPTAGRSSSFGFTNASIWVRFRLRDASPLPVARVIGSDFNLIDTLDYYLIREATGQVIHQQNGRLIPHHQQRIDSHSRIFPLHVLPNETYAVYFRVAGRNAKRIELTIEETYQHQAGYQRATWFWAGYVGFYLTMILVQVIFFAMTRNRNSLYYLLYLCGFLLVEVCRGNGMIGDRYLWPDATWFKSNSLLIGVPVSTVLGMWFYANGLRLKQYVPVLYRVLQVDAGVTLLLAGWALSKSADTNVVQHVLFTALASDLLVLVACFWVWRKGYQPARFYLLGTLCFFGSIVVTLFWNLGLLPDHFITAQSLNIGCVLEMLFFTTALADEYRLTQREKQQAQTELIDVLQNRNNELRAAQLQGQTLERQRVAADLHDNLGSTLSALHWNLQAMNTSQLTPAEQAVYTAIRQQIGQAYTDVRLLSHNLLPQELAKQGLPSALKTLVGRLNRNTTTHFNLTDIEIVPRLDPQTEFELYSICLELVNNTLKHAGATEATITFSLTDDTLHLHVTDNGVGLNEQTTNGYGMQNIAARIASIGGQWSVESEPGAGVRHQIQVPVGAPVGNG
ncbi:7TM diverse intracellular signaling domain-containing protein [Spirosoma montaniterrae]|uniref:histidine kinase n=1 Tax=Spirosoma montaniterrae TaxID=1178516 RepID=A0A1P9WT39_9BACT|nr:7TM diverse intracellular signaling domain-containing protein [Spirosoma montaniterrae]AQG78528.1 hypothetical protein AWR27_03735 [Spirosoma montaniterrae]